MKDIKHTVPDFHSVAWVMPQGWDFVELGVGRVKSFRLSDTLSPPSRWTKSNQILCEFLSLMGRAAAHFWPAPGVLGRGQNVGYH